MATVRAIVQDRPGNIRRFISTAPLFVTADLFVRENR